MADINPGNAMAFPVARKNGKRANSMKQASSNLFYLWHKIQDIKTEAEQMKDSELVFMIGLVERGDEVSISNSPVDEKLLLPLLNVLELLVGGAQWAHV